MRLLKYSLLMLGIVTFATTKALSADVLSEKETMDFLEKIEKSFSKTQSLKASFRQEKKLSLFAENLTSSGIIYFESPDKMRMELQKPFLSLTIINGNSITKYENKDGAWKPISVTNPDVSRVVSQQMTGWLTGNFRKQTDFYKFVLHPKTPITIELIPRMEGVKEMIRSIMVTLTKDRLNVQKIEINESRGDQTTMYFENTVRNPALEESLFQSP